VHKLFTTFLVLFFLTYSLYLLSLCWAAPARPAIPEIHIRASSVSLGWACQSCTGLHELCFAGPHLPGLHRPAWSPFHWAVPTRPAMLEIHTHTQSLFHWATPPRPAQACMISALPGHAPKACHAWDTHMHNLRSAGPCSPGLRRPAQYPLWKPVPLSPAKPGTHTHMTTILLGHAPQASQAGDAQTCRISTPPAHVLQTHQAHTPKACYFTSAKGLHL
jgi:hypothetical protein